MTSEHQCRYKRLDTRACVEQNVGAYWRQFVNIMYSQHCCSWFNGLMHQWWARVLSIAAPWFLHIGVFSQCLQSFYQAYSLPSDRIICIFACYWYHCMSQTRLVILLACRLQGLLSGCTLVSRLTRFKHPLLHCKHSQTSCCKWWNKWQPRILCLLLSRCAQIFSIYFMIHHTCTAISTVWVWPLLDFYGLLRVCSDV